MAILFAVSFSACGDDDDGGSGNVDCDNATEVNNAIADEAQAVTDASTAFANDPSDANCEAFKNAYLDYIDVLRDLQDCANQAGVGDTWQTTLDQAETAAEALLCM
ncbi:MAG: hypothetical protein AAGA77_20425 [Bacteroidota bacterium]